MKTIIFNTLKFLRPIIASLKLQKLFPKSGWWYDDFAARFVEPVEFAEVEGSKMYVDIRHPDPELRATFRSYAFNKVHEPASTSLIKQVVGKEDKFVDVGANIGHYSLLAARLVGPEGQVHSFEPEPRNFEFLRKNLEVNGYTHAHPNNKAISDSSGTEKLFICPYDSGHHTLRQHGGIEEISRGHDVGDAKTVEVEAVSLDDYFSQNSIQPRVFKIDAEGAEELVIAGMQRYLKEVDEIAILIEFYPLLLEKMGTDPTAFVGELFNDYGVTAFAVSGDYSMSEDNDNLLVNLGSTDEALALCPY